MTGMTWTALIGHANIMNQNFCSRCNLFWRKISMAFAVVASKRKNYNVKGFTAMQNHGQVLPAIAAVVATIINGSKRIIHHPSSGIQALFKDNPWLMIGIPLIQNLLEAIGPACFKWQASTSIRSHSPGVGVSKTQNTFWLHDDLV